MPSTRLVLPLAVAAAALALAGCGGSINSATTTSTSTTTSTTTTTTTTAATATGKPGKKLEGSVGPGFVIGLTKGGQPVTTLAAGAYTLVVDDMSNVHNFHLTGPGVDVSTTVEETGTKTFRVKLRAGSYHYQCDPHASTMQGDFTVTG
jgi:plastocyanin